MEKSLIAERIRRSRKTRRKARKAAGWVLLAFLVVPVLMVMALRWVNPPTSSFMLLSCIRAWQDDREDYRVRWHWVDWDDISSHIKLAVIAAEDQKFFEHGGFDFESMADAWQDHQQGIRLRGASTITQQVAKNIFLWPGKSFLRKGLEAYLTFLIEFFWPKRRILEVYLNIVEFGDGVYGVGAAGEHFFNRPSSKLSRGNSSILAAVLPNPRRFRANRPSPYVRKRSAWILRQMRLLGGTSYLKRFH